MTLDKAIEILSQELTYTYPARFNDLQKAQNLGIEALKLVQRERLLGINPVETQLPGETEE